MSDSPTCGCGLMMSRNPHPSAGYPTEEAIEAGYEWECIPCLVKTRNRVGREMRKAQAERERLWNTLVEIDIYLASDPDVWRLVSVAKVGDVLCDVLGADLIQRINAEAG